MKPIFVPTKGRADCVTLPHVLQEAGLEFTLVVEPQEERIYRSQFPKAAYLILGEGDKGIVFARQSILEHARQQGIDWYWQIDDNIKGFYRIDKGQCIKANPSEALEYASQFIEMPHIALIGFQYQQFAWSAKKAYQLNRYVYCCTLTNANTGFSYRSGTDMKEDVDFLLQHLHNRWRSVMVNKFAMDKPTMGANSKGGLAPLYREGQNSEAAKRIVTLWPQYCSLVPKKRGLDAKINWRMIDSLFQRVA